MNPITNRILPLLFTLVMVSNYTFSQDAVRVDGPTIENYGSTFAIDDSDFKIDPNKVYKVVFDIHNYPEDPGSLNPMINTLARFINMHTNAGIPLKNLKVVGIIHNKASKDAMNNEAYHEKFGVDNPNIPLMEALEEAGAEIYMCGQSIHARGVDPARMAAPIKTALSAMTVILSKQSEGYQLIRF